MADAFRPPQGVRDEAKKALEWMADGKAGSGFTDTGRKRAADLAAGNAVSEDVILRMYSFFKRHEVDKQATGFNFGEEGFPSAGRVAWSAWGGDAGFAWSSSIREKLAARSVLLIGESMESRESATIPDLAEELQELLGSTFSMYFLAHGAHWNVTGANFSEYHELFGEIYADVWGSVDDIAENLRKIGSKAPASLAEVIPTSDPSLLTSNVGQVSTILALRLRDANEVILDQLNEVFNCATSTGQQGIANFVAGRIDTHQKWQWQLTASIGEEVVAEVESPEYTTEDETSEVEAEVVMPDQMSMMRSSDGVDETQAESATPSEVSMIEERKSAIASAERLTFEAEVRSVATDDGSLRIGGYAAQFNKEATGLNFREMIAPGAFKRSLQSGEPVFLLVNHDTDQLPLASTQSGTLVLSEDEVGLRMEATLDPSNPRAAELASALTRGDVDKMSFAFSVAPGGDTREEGLRTLTDLNLFEVSVVTWPAYDASSVGMRSEDSDVDDLELRKRKIALKFKLDSL